MQLIAIFAFMGSLIFDVAHLRSQLLRSVHGWKAVTTIQPKLVFRRLTNTMLTFSPLKSDDTMTTKADNGNGKCFGASITDECCHNNWRHEIVQLFSGQWAM
jgi:hypothetical protein